MRLPSGRCTDTRSPGPATALARPMPDLDPVAAHRVGLGSSDRLDPQHSGNLLCGTLQIVVLCFREHYDRERGSIYWTFPRTVPRPPPPWDGCCQSERDKANDCN